MIDRLVLSTGWYSQQALQIIQNSTCSTMLRRTKANSKKRHSMFLDIRSSITAQGALDEEDKFDAYQGKNKSADTLPLDDFASTSSTMNSTKKPQRKGKLKRSSVILDNTLVRDYNLAIRHFEKLDTRTMQASHSNKSIASTGSTVSSLFSSTSTTSIRDLLYDAMEKEYEEDCQIIDKSHNMNFDCRLRADGTSSRYIRTNLDFE